MQGICGRNRSFPCSIKVLVEICKRCDRLTLQHVLSEDFRSFGPMIECDQAQSHCAISSMRAVVQPLRFKVFLIIAQARNNLADTVKVVPSILAKETHPAMKQPIK